MNTNSHSISDIKKKINLYFDNALDQSDSSELITQVSNNPKIHSIYTKEKDFRDYIKNAITRPSVSSNLLQNIKKSISIE